MQVINANLSAAQLKFPHWPVVTAALVDTPVLRPEVLHTGLADATDFDGVLTATALVQVKSGPAISYKLYAQKITDADVKAQWQAWTEINANKCRAVTCFTSGAYVVAVFWRDAGATFHLEWQRSADDGVTWSAAQTIKSVSSLEGAYSAFAGVDGVGLMLYNAGTRKVNYYYYTAATDTFGGPIVSGFTLAANQNVLALAATLHAAAGAALIFLSYQDLSGGNNKVQRCTMNLTTGAFSALEDVFSVAKPASYYSHMSLSQAQIDSRWWLTLMRWNASTTRLVYLLCAVYYADSEYRVSGAIEFERQTAESGRVKVYPVSDVTGGVILASLRQAKRSVERQTYFTGRTVLSYRWDASAGRLRCVLDNRDKVITEPPFLASLTLSRGLKVGANTYLQALPTFYISAFAFTDDDNMVEIEGVDALGLLELWSATETERWAGKTVAELVRYLCGRAKVFDVTFDASADWATVVTDFTLHNGRSALFGVQALLGRVGKARAIARGEGLYCFVLGDTAQHSYSGQQYWRGRFGRGLLTNYAMVAGASDSAVGDYAGEEEETGFRVADVILDSQVVTVAGAESLAESVVAYSQQGEAGRGELLAPVNFALEPGDVLEFSPPSPPEGGGSLWASGKLWRVTGLVEEYRTGEQPFGQIIGLRAV